MKPFLFLSVLILLAFIWPACEVAVTTDEETIRVQDMLMSGEWQMTELKNDGISIWADVDSCLKDDIEIYKANGKAETRNGVRRCLPDEPAIEPWNWGLLDEGKRLWWGYQGDNDTGTINVLNNASLHITYFVTSQDQGRTEFFVRYTNVK